MALHVFAALLVAAVNLIAVPNVDIAVAQNRLPQCSGSHWHNCTGRSDLSSGDRYVGEFRNGKRNGQGTYTWANGNRYVGEFVNDKIEGQGTFTFKDGAKYVGPFHNEKRNGRGTYSWANGNVYVGDFVNDKIEGFGTFSFANGNKYVGPFRNETRNGRGTFTWKDGNMYVGDFVDDKMHGQGVFTFANGEKYVGEFRGEKRNGFGTYTFPSGDRYVGEFLNDNYNGNSEFFFGDGRKFVGEFRDGKKNGRGTFTFTNGEKYVGEFASDTRNGRGILFAANGTVKQSGNWQNDNFMGGPTVALDQVSPPPLPQQAQQQQQQQQQQAVLQQPPVQQQQQQVFQSQSPNANQGEGRRVALIIGNTNYRFASALQNPSNDADLLANTLRSAGFQTVMVKTDLDREGMIRTLREFSNIADSADWAVVYYSGHGIEFGGVNFMVPVDAQLKVDRDIDLETVDVGKVMSAIDGARRLRLVILDACRDNPFASQMKRTIATRSLGRGLAQLEPTVGTLTVFAAKHGETALDGSGRNSPFVEALVKRINQKPSIEIRRLFDFVRDDVLSNTNRRQQPFSYGSLSASEDFYFVR